MQLPVGARRLFYRSAYRGLVLYWLLLRPEKPGVKCLVTRADRLLLVRHTYGESCWDLPGGGIKGGEAPVQAVQREMREELGVDRADYVYLGEIRGIVQHRRDTIHCFSAELTARAITLELGELSAASWFDPADLPPGLGPYVLPALRRAYGEDRGGRPALSPSPSEPRTPTQHPTPTR